MAIASSGAIKLTRDIGAELGESPGAQIGLRRASIGSYESINTNNDAADRPDGLAPHLMSEFYSYDHSAAQAGFGGIFIDDFHTTGGSDPMDARITYATTGLQDSQSFPTDGDSNTVTTRPVWTYNNGDAGTSHEGNDTIRLNYAASHPQWRNTNITPQLNFSGTMNVEFSFYMTTNTNKDIMLMIDCISQGDYWSTGNLKDGYFLQIDDSSSRWLRMRRRNNNGGSTTLGTSSNSAFVNDAWQTCKITWNQSTGDIKTYIGGVLKLSVNDTTFDDFCPNGAGIRFMSARFMSPASAYNEMDWIKVWKS